MEQFAGFAIAFGIEQKLGINEQQQGIVRALFAGGCDRLGGFGGTAAIGIEDGAESGVGAF